MKRTLMVLLGRLTKVEIFQWKTNCFCTDTDKILSRKEKEGILH